MKYLLFFLPSIAIANFVAEGGKTAYWFQSDCEAKEKAVCYQLPKEDTDVVSLKEVEVPDTSKPILETSQAVIEIDPDTKEEKITCEKDAYFNFDTRLCQKVIGYETKLEKQFAEDPIKIAEKEAKLNEQQAAQEQCNQFKTLLADSAIDDKSTDKDVMEVTKRLLGFYKSCLR